MVKPPIQFSLCSNPDIYAERDFATMPILGDALMDAGCDCRSMKPHARGCWVVDAILGKS